MACNWQQLLDEPRWREEDLGAPLPDSPHAVSVALPRWAHVVGYEENDPAVRDRLQTGYPRFVQHRFVQELSAFCAARFAGRAECALPYPSERVARRCTRYIRAKTGLEARVAPLGRNGIHIVCFPEAAREAAGKYWQHFGEVVSSRRALATIEERDPPDSAVARQWLREKIAGYTGAAPEDVYLYPSGMAALTEALCMAQAQAPGAKNVQLGFPYVDVLKIQTVWGPGAHFFPHADAESEGALRKLLEAEPLSGVITEFPGNPLLRGADLPALGTLLRRYGVPLIVDDTPGTFANLDTLPHADVLVSSLTKAFSGVGDVMAGALVLNRRSQFYEAFSGYQRAQYEDLLWDEDALALRENAGDFTERVARMNTNGLALAEYLQGHPAVAQVHYPAFNLRGPYDALKKAGAGYSGLLSMVLARPEQAPRFYDRLRVCKGPSLGNNFTIACPYTLLAHYDELDWAESAGISRWLVRVSMGLEGEAELIRRFEEALKGL